MRYIGTHPGSFAVAVLLVALVVLALSGCEFAEEHPHGFVVPFFLWHFPAGLTRPTPHYFPSDLPMKE